MTTSEDLQAEINSILETIKNLQFQLASTEGSGSYDPSFLKEENSQIQTYLTDFITKEGVLLTIASLFSFLSFSNDKIILSNFLIWTLPILIFAIVCYFLSTKRFNILQSIRRNLNLKLLSDKEINDILKKTYFNTLKYHTLTDLALVSYFVSFILNYYFYFYFGVINIKISISILIISILFGVWRYLNVKDKSDIKGLVATGGPSKEDGIRTFGAVGKPASTYIPTDKSKDPKIMEFNPDWSKSYQDIIPKLTSFNQRDIPACVAHTTASMMQIEWYRRTGKIINFSPRFLDILSWTDDLGINDGRDPNVVMNLSITIGCCTEDLLPNDTTLPIEKYRDKTLITEAMLSEAKQYRLEKLGLTFKSLW